MVHCVERLLGSWGTCHQPAPALKALLEAIILLSNVTQSRASLVTVIRSGGSLVVLSQIAITGQMPLQIIRTEHLKDVAGAQFYAVVFR